LATLVLQAYYGAGPSWTNLVGGQLVGFYGATYDSKVVVDSYQASTHISGAGGDICLTNHVRNVKYITSTEFDSGSGTETLGNGTLAATECTLKVFLSGGASVRTQNGRVYCYNGTTITTYATDIQMYAFEAQIGATTWTLINNGTISGGDNNGQRLNLQDHGTPAATHEWFVALSASPKSVGAKTSFAIGSSVEYF
jgi:hypothetical protein